jgi:hypothetical protein
VQVGGDGFGAAGVVFVEVGLHERGVPLAGGVGYGVGERVAAEVEQQRRRGWR